VSIAVAITGCASPTPGDVVGSAAPLLITSHCTLNGTAGLPGGIDIHGSITGVPSITGTWTNTDPAGSFVGTPTALTCRIDGATLADVSGTGTYDGASGYTFSLHVQDRGVPGTPTRSPGTPTPETLTATRTYSPGTSTDATLAFALGATVPVPASLPVTTGNAGDEWASITFVDHDSGSPLRCVYRGDLPDCDDRHEGAVSSGSGSQYVFVACEWGAPDPHAHCDDGEHHGDDRGHDDHEMERSIDDEQRCGALVWTIDPTIVAGSVIDTDSVLLHIVDGSHRSPRPSHPITIVTWSFTATPFVIRVPEPDFYRLEVFDSTGAMVDFAAGDLSSGDLTIAAVP
jgi:hypothetical protein